ncbi:hypothetical protein GCM10020367_29800 [Streptomyces sannanensis]|uniref:Uncharacterized protein n=1 Tax=Streptomyces sannanensis TaxID=285536 RepID=A0ABP6SC54_9ACTN
MALFHEAQMQEEVGGFEPYVGFEPRVAAEGHRPVPGGRALGFHDPGAPGQRTERGQGALRVGRLGQGETQRVVAQLLLLQTVRPRVGIARVLLGDDQVEVAGEQPGEGRLRLQLRDVDPQTGMRFTQQGQRSGDQGEGGGLEGGHAEGAGEVGEGGVDLGLGAFQSLEDRLGVGDEYLGLLGQPHPAPDRLQQPDADLRLQLGELLGDRGRAVREGGGDGRERAPVLELTQQTQPVQIEHRAAPTAVGSFRFP